MPSINAGDLESCLRTKLRAVETQGKHRQFEIRDEAGRPVAKTMMSNSWRGTTPIGAALVSQIKRQLFLPRTSDLVDLVSCTMSRDEYLKLFP